MSDPNRPPPPLGYAYDCTGKLVKAKWGLCRLCDRPLTRSSLDDAHLKCQRLDNDDKDPNE